MIRTDLAVEAHELANKNGEIKGVSKEEYKIGEIGVTKFRVLNEEGQNCIGKPIGTYVTIDIPNVDGGIQGYFDEAVDAVSGQLRELLLPFGKGPVLVAGLGNALMTPDALGPKCIDSVLITRHIAGELCKIPGLEGLRAVAAISPGVLGQTGVETGEIIKSLVQKIKPDVVIAVDALASRRASRLGRTVQLSDTGITPGSGVGNSRFAVNKETLGVPVISIGVPTVIDAATLTIDVLEAAGIRQDENEEEKIRESIEPGGIEMFVTPRSVDTVIAHVARLVGYSINKALHDGVEDEDMHKLVS